MTHKICSNGNRCALQSEQRGQTQSIATEFTDRWGKEVATCLTCRTAKADSRRRTATGQGRYKGGVMGLSNPTPPGPPPQFIDEAHRRQWQRWLRGLIAQVQRSPQINLSIKETNQ